MLRATRRRIGAPAWLALTIVVGLPAMAEAQLFPNRTIRRQRESCAAEPPYYGQVRRDYFGYFPTCWSKFPDGWGCPCPNPELPNAKAAFEKRPREKLPPDLDLGDPSMNPDRGPATDDRPMTDPVSPPPPNPNRSPFDLNPDMPGTAPDGTAPARPPVNPRQGDDPAAPVSRPNGATSLLEMPKMTSPAIVAEPTVMPGSMMLAAEATLASNTTTRPDLGPLPSAPTPAPFTPGDSSASSMVVVETPAPTNSTTTTTRAPKRKSILGGLFGSGNKQVR